MASDILLDQEGDAEEQVEETAVPRRRHYDDAEMDITPMIDITFLLLIFFLVASKMDSAAAVKLPLARAGDAIAAKASVIIVIRKGSGDQAEVFKGNGEEFSRDLEEQEQQIIDYIESNLVPPKQFVLVRGEGEVKHGEVARVARAIGRASPVGGEEAVQQFYIAVKESR